MFMVTRWPRVMLSAVLVVMLPAFTRAQPQVDSLSKETAAAAVGNGESERDTTLPDSLDSSNEEDRLVILPEIKRDGERFYLSSFKLPTS